jgi:ABC-type branched-subunit amino acid transport system ATPase component
MENIPFLKIESLTKSFGGVTAVADISFSMDKGETLGVIGPNGSGKTTLANLITRFVKADSGQVFFKGKEISHLPPHKVADQGIVRTFQVMRPFYSLPAYKNLIVPLWSPRRRRAAGGGLGDRDAIALDILEDIGFERDAHVPFKTASSLPLGYLKRLELARCLAMQPEVIICDEVFSGLSMAEIATMVPLIERMQIEGKTIIMIEHRLRELFRLVQRVIVLNFGIKISEGTPKEIVSNEEVKRAYLGRKGV